MVTGWGPPNACPGAEIITVPPAHPVYRWNCLVTGCERPKTGHGDLCSAHLELWRHAQRDGELKADFLRAARPAGLAAWTDERPCRVCPQRPARTVALVLCDKHQFRWFRHRELHGGDADFAAWLAGQEPYPGYGCCRVRVCSELANSPLGLCAGHESRYRAQGRPGAVIRRARRPFPDGVARALADEANLRKLAAVYDPCDRGLRDAWETIVVTGRRCGEVLGLRLDCLGRYGGLPMLWHDQTKVGNYDAAIHIPERVHQLLEARQHKTVAVFTTRHNRPPTTEERAHLALFPTSRRTTDGRRSLSYKWFHKGFKGWVDDLDIGRWVPHQARHSLATSLLRAGASLTHIRRYLGQVSEKMAEHYVHLTQTDLEDVLQHVWVAGPGAARPGELISGPAAALSAEQAQALAIDLSRRSTPAEGGFCTFQPVVDGGACPWNLDCHNCGNFVLSGADLLYWRRKREQWYSLAERAPG